MLKFISTNNDLKPYYDGLLITEAFNKTYPNQLKDFIVGSKNMELAKSASVYMLTLKLNKEKLALFVPVIIEYNGSSIRCLAFLEQIENQSDQQSKFVTDANVVASFRKNILERIKLASLEAFVKVDPESAAIAPKVIILRDATKEEQLKLLELMSTLTLETFQKTLAEIDRIYNCNNFFNKIIFFIPSFKLKTNLITTLCISSQTQGATSTALEKLWKSLIVTMIKNPRLGQNILSVACFAIFYSPDETSSFCKNTSTAFWLLANPHSRSLVIAAIKTHLHNNSHAVSNILDNLFLVRIQDNVMQCLLWELKTPKAEIDLELVKRLVLAKMQGLSDQAKWEFMFCPNEKTENFSPFLLLMRFEELSVIVENLFSSECNFAFLNAENFYAKRVHGASYLFQLICPNPVLLCDVGIKLLDKVYRRNPGLLQSLNIQHLCRSNLDPNANKRPAFLTLSRINPAGIELIKLILLEHKDIKREFKLADLTYTDTDHRGRQHTLFMQFYEDDNHEVFQILLHNNPKLALELKESAYPKDRKLNQIIETVLKLEKSSLATNIHGFHYQPAKQQEAVNSMILRANISNLNSV